MSGRDPGLEFIHRLPAYIMHDFYLVMDSLDSTDWGRFASSIVSDMTELRLLERQGEPGRTQRVMWYWINRNGTVSQLLHVLTSLNLWRARDIILSWQPPVQLPRPEAVPAVVTPYRPAVGPLPSSTLLSSMPDAKMSLSGKLSERETVAFNSPVVKSELPHPPSPPDSLFTYPGKDPANTCPPSPPSMRKNVYYWPLCELKSGTHDFAEKQKIGEGGFGCVYRALMRHTEYAVKRLKEESDLDWKIVRESFYTELEKLYQYRHPNIMDLAGCCVEDGVYCLVSTYMPNGSLQDRLQCQDGTLPLCWMRRLDVMLGAARAIQFLHCSEPSVIHGDVKSSNILLDENFVPKLGDFGLARFSRYSNNSGKSCTVARTQTLRGTLAYLPDEFIKSGQLAVELDTYSFGVVLLEILTGRKALENKGSAKSKYLKDIIEEEEENEEEEERSGQTESAMARSQRVAARVCQKHMDRRAGPCAGDIPLQLCLLATECLNHRRKRRPKMMKVYERLEELRASMLDSHKPPSLRQAPEERSAAEVADRLQRSSLSPTENTYRFGGAETAGPRPILDSCPLLRSQRHSQRPEQAPGSAGGHSFSFSSLCRPVKSGESSTDHGGGSSLPGLRNTRRPLPADLPYWSSSGPLQPPEPGVPTPSLSADSPGSSLPSRQIVVNPAKQRILQQFALYNAGQIDSSELLSSAPGRESWSGVIHRAPEESDEFD
ncbi:interleukin-1 receptor-associated kinase 1 [Narcine bancroftii]|uniref:interleukin-1 receptor-associated kinase 1 n=1 Tax=Narcine bancroftii TaxID=1343680 RepID=UPI0038314F81